MFLRKIALTERRFCGILNPLPKQGVFYLAWPLYLRRNGVVGMSNILSMVKIFSFELVAGTPKTMLVSWFREMKRVLKKHPLDIAIGALLLGIGGFVLIPHPEPVDETYLATLPDEEETRLLIQEMQNEASHYGTLPFAKSETPKQTVKIPLTAYTSDVAQTDSTPCITASGLDVCERNVENVVAANFLPIGTRVRIPELYGDRVFYVEDRMNARYYYKMDVWMKDINDARQFGVQYATVEIF